MVTQKKSAKAKAANKNHPRLQKYAIFSFIILWVLPWPITIIASSMSGNFVEALNDGASLGIIIFYYVLSPIIIASAIGLLTAYLSKKNDHKRIMKIALIFSSVSSSIGIVLLLLLSTG